MESSQKIPRFIFIYYLLLSLLRNNARNGQPRNDSKVVVMDAMAFLQDLHDMHSTKWRPLNSGNYNVNFDSALYTDLNIARRSNSWCE